MFPGETAEERKLFVTLGHRDGALECIKATSNTAPFKKNSRLATGCVFYPGGVVAAFPKDTYIDPANRFSVPYAKAAEPGVVRGMMPPEFHDQLVYVIKASYVLTIAEKKELLALIGAAL